MASRDRREKTIKCPSPDCDNEEQVQVSESGGPDFLRDPNFRIDSTLQGFRVVQESHGFHRPTKVECGECKEVFDLE